ncbi:hypothetical protein ACLOJK_022805, partial [Asimina triloba]
MAAGSHWYQSQARSNKRRLFCQIPPPGIRTKVLSAFGPDRLVGRPGLSPAHISPANPHDFVPAQRKPNWPDTLRTPSTVTSSLKPVATPTVATTPTTPIDKRKRPMVPAPEYIHEITGGASARLPEDILPIEEPNPKQQHLEKLTQNPLKKKMNLSNLEKHYAGMSARYYLLGGLDDTNVKQVYLNSLPPPLGDDTKRYFAGKNLKLHTVTLGELYTQSLITLDRLCNQKAFLEAMQNLGSGFTKFYDRPDLSIKCKPIKLCKCPAHPRKKPEKKFPKFSKRKKKKFRFFKKKPKKGKTSTLCFLCKKPGHYAKDCPLKIKRKKVFKQASMILAEEFSDLESVLTEEEVPTVDTVLFFSDSSDDEFTESENIYTIQGPGPSIVPSQEPWPIESLTIPVATVSIYPTKYDKPFRVEVLFDTGAAATMAQTETLPKDCWKPYHRVFKAANGESFEADHISKMVTLQIFPTVSIRHQIVGSDIIGKPLIIGFDILQRLKLQWSNNGLHHRQQILPWNSAPIFIIDSSPQSYGQIKQAIINTNGAESHIEFLTFFDPRSCGDGSRENLVVKGARVGVVPGWVTEQEVLSETPLRSTEARGNGGRRPVGVGPVGLPLCMNKTVRVGWADVGGAEAWASYQSIRTQSGEYLSSDPGWWDLTWRFSIRSSP